MDPIFSRVCFCLGMIPGLFHGDGRVIGLSCLFRSPRISLGISVENHDLEIAGFDSESGLILGDSVRKGLSYPWSHSEDILANVLTVVQFLVVASTESSLSNAALESLVLPYPLGQ
jgi:hypothetical protein